MNDKPETGRYAHHFNIEVGRGRIIYADEPHLSNFQSGWVLPGGKRTNDEAVARGFARWIDTYTKSHAKR